jgi:hypothetical protein
MSRTCSPRRCDREPPTVGCLANATRWHPRPAGAPGSATTTPTRGEARARGVDAHEASSPCLAAPPNSVRRAVGSAAATSALTSWRTIALKPQLQRRAESVARHLPPPAGGGILHSRNRRRNRLTHRRAANPADSHQLPSPLPAIDQIT